MPTPRKVSEIKTNLLRPALTSHFEVELYLPNGENFQKYLVDNGIIWNSVTQNALHLMCNETVLPGSSLATHEINNDFTGVTERHVYRRLYDDRIDLTFYVDAQNYFPIRLFETWIKYCVDESITEQTTKARGSRDSSYFYRVRYSDDYVASSLRVIKFERDYRQRLEYEFIRTFPISISSMPVSYDSSSLLKCTVSMTYIRYVLYPVKSSLNDSEYANQNIEQQAKFNGEYNWAENYNSIFENPSFGVGGVSDSAAQSSGNPVDRRVEAGLPFVGRNRGPIARFSGI
jgi:hypothetical protein